uniref:Lactoylglutathione lyase n=1 Tax=Thermosporothrix sp. COM3 TaxID=2490863 RepID=A0A455SGK4_9CHLR|nr:lactoylglutathione lyase [Thermosporothrix sp. COM3]
MMKLNHLSIIPTDMERTISFFQKELNLPVKGDASYAEVNTGDIIISLSPSAAVPTERPQGVVLQFEVDNVVATLEQVRARGGWVLRDPELMPWGTESAYVAGPDGLIVEFYRWP